MHNLRFLKMSAGPRDRDERGEPFYPDPVRDAEFRRFRSESAAAIDPSMADTAFPRTIDLETGRRVRLSAPLTIAGRPDGGPGSGYVFSHGLQTDGTCYLHAALNTVAHSAVRGLFVKRLRARAGLPIDARGREVRSLGSTSTARIRDRVASLFWRGDDLDELDVVEAVRRTATHVGYRRMRDAILLAVMDAPLPAGFRNRAVRDPRLDALYAIAAGRYERTCRGFGEFAAAQNAGESVPAFVRPHAFGWPEIAMANVLFDDLRQLTPATFFRSGGVAPKRIANFMSCGTRGEEGYESKMVVIENVSTLAPDTPSETRALVRDRVFAAGSGTATVFVQFPSDGGHAVSVFAARDPEGSARAFVIDSSVGAFDDEWYTPLLGTCTRCAFLLCCDYEVDDGGGGDVDAAESTRATVGAGGSAEDELGDRAWREADAWLAIVLAVQLAYRTGDEFPADALEHATRAAEEVLDVVCDAVAASRREGGGGGGGGSPGGGVDAGNGTNGARTARAVAFACVAMACVGVASLWA